MEEKKLKKKESAKTEKSASRKSTIKQPELLVVIVNRNKAEYYEDVVQSLGSNMQFTVFGRGTSEAETHSWLSGAAGAGKAVVFSVFEQKKAEEALDVLDEKMHSGRGRKGVAFTVPFSSVIGTAVYSFLIDNRRAVKEEESF